MRFREPVSAYLHFIKTTSRRCPDINPNPKRYCEFCGLRSSSLGAHDDADADGPPPAAMADPQLSVDAGYIVKTKLHSAISSQPPLFFLSKSPFLPGSFRQRIRTRTDLFTTTRVQVFTLTTAYIARKIDAPMIHLVVL